jgi:acetyltransferase-like isoleucine patch superfamily enzyme
LNKKLHAQLTDESKSPLQRYQQVVVGSQSLAYTIRYEVICGLFGSFPGALGMWLRRRFYKSILNRMGRGVIIGAGTQLHHARKIALGDRVAVAYRCLLDARGDSNEGITIGDDVTIGRNTGLICKNGDIRIGSNVGIGANISIHAVDGNRIEIGDNVIIAPYTYVGATMYNTDRTDIPITLQGPKPLGGVRVEDNVWLGANVIIFDGITIGRDAIVGAGAVVTRDVPPYAVALGVPAKVVKMRNEVGAPIAARN